MSSMKEALRLLVTACERSRDCAADVSKVRGGRSAQALDAERILSDVLSLAKQKVEGLESTAESALCELSARPGPSEETVGEEDRNRRLSEVSLWAVRSGALCSLTLGGVLSSVVSLGVLSCLLQQRGCVCISFHFTV